MKISKNVFEYLQIILGAFLVAFSVTVFLVPLKITTGGVSALGTVFLYILNIPISVTNIVLNAILFLIGYKSLGKKMLVRTVYGVVLLTLFFEICTLFPKYAEDMTAAALSGGILLGMGLGLVIRAEGSTGGTDFLSIMIHRKNAHISVSTFILLVDFVIILVSGFVFESVTVILYSLISLFLASKVCDFVLTFGKSAKKIEILSVKSEYIADKILTKFSRGVTGIHSRGMYSGTDRLMLMCVISPRELPRLTNFVRQCDPRAFICISDVREVLGEGFKN